MASLKRRARLALQRHFNLIITHSGRMDQDLERHQLGQCVKEFGVDCVFDVGANAGQYAYMLREIGYTGPIVSFEPIPHLAQELRNRAKGDPNWYIEEVALDETVRETVFRVMENSEFSSFHAPSVNETVSFSDWNRQIDCVPLKTGLLSTYYEEYKRIIGFSRPFLKMDTQGHDVSVARGGGEALKRFVGLQSELAIRRLYKDQPDYHDAVSFYRSCGFEVCSIIPNHPHFPELLEVDCIMYNPALLNGSAPAAPETCLTGASASSGSARR